MCFPPRIQPWRETRPLPGGAKRSPPRFRGALAIHERSTGRAGPSRRQPGTARNPLVYEGEESRDTGRRQERTSQRLNPQADSSVSLPSPRPRKSRGYGHGRNSISPLGHRARRRAGPYARGCRATCGRRTFPHREATPDLRHPPLGGHAQRDTRSAPPASVAAASRGGRGCGRGNPTSRPRHEDVPPPGRRDPFRFEAGHTSGRRSCAGGRADPLVRGRTEPW